MELGGNITLSGFKDIGKAEMVVVKKVVGSYARKLTESVPKFENLGLNLKSVHKTEGSDGKFEIHCKAMVDGKPITSEITDRNLFVGLDEVLKKVFALSTKQ